MTTDEQEALSRRYGDDIILMLPLSSGSIAVFNSARELCAIIPHAHHTVVTEITAVWYPPTRALPRQGSTLEELGL